MAASQVVIYSVFFLKIFEQAGPNLSLLQIAKLRWFGRLSRLFRTSTHREKVRELATAGLTSSDRKSLIVMNMYNNKLPERRPIGIRVGIFEQAGPNLTSAQIHVVNFDVLVFGKAC